MNRLETWRALWVVGIESVWLGMWHALYCGVRLEEPWQGNPGKWLCERIYGVQDARDILDPNQKIQRIRREMAPVVFVLRKRPWFWKEISHSDAKGGKKENRIRADMGQG